MFNNEVDVYIEISKNTSIKYEFDKEINSLRCDRILRTPFVYPENYGFIPNTMAMDNDELDALVLSKHSFQPGTVIRCKILGYLEMTDEKGLDEKMIVVPIDKIDNINSNYNDISDISVHILDNIQYFFTHYKDMDKDKWSKVNKFYNMEEAIKLYKKYSVVKE